MVSPTSVSISGIDGTPLKVQGCTQILLSRMDEHVHLPEFCADCVVVESLSQVNADVVMGVDTISSLGGVDLKYDEGCLTAVQFGLAAAVVEDKHPLPSVSVSSQGNDVVLDMDDTTVRWKSAEGYWELQWKWQEGHDPDKPLGSGIGQYPRHGLSAGEEEQFVSAIEERISSGWLV